ncbi:MAG: protein kinase [Anaerolineales bacterium]|nr:protein kinase [Anaerolineales bacterium]
MADWIGQRIGKYRIKELIGRGKMGKVYRAHQPNLERDVAIKINDTAMGKDPSVIGRFRQEARVIASLRHPGIVHVYDFDIIGDAFYMVMELIEGQTLKERLVAVHDQGERTIRL